MKNKKAFTLLEIMVVVGLMAIIFLIPVLYTQASQVRFDFNTQVSTAVSYLRLAQSDAAAGRDNKKHGVHLAADSYTVFSGDSFNPSDEANFEIELPPTIVIRNVSLNGGGSDVIFSGPYGETQAYGTFQLYSQQINKSLTINVSQIGTINY
jgi:prepilin-type N-terminal cleavage/methylation domain-containing protein